MPRWDLLVEDNFWREVGYTMTAANWLQTVENIMDPVHVEWLHGVFRNYAAERTGNADLKRKRVRHQKIGFDLAEYGIIKRRILEGESEESDDWKVGHWLVFPTIQKGPDMLRFRVPVDETHTAQWITRSIHSAKAENETAEEMPLYHMPSPELDRHGQPQFELRTTTSTARQRHLHLAGAVHDRTKEARRVRSRCVLYRHLLDNQTNHRRGRSDQYLS